jgi:hypothetical protein
MAVAFRQIGLSQSHSHARRVLNWIAAQSPRLTEVSREHLRTQALGRRLTADRTQAVLQGLQAAGWLRRVEQASGRQGGRPAQRWQVNPKLWQQGGG